MIIKKEKKKRSMSKLIVPFVIVSIFSFTGVAVYVQLKTNTELSSTLIMCFFGFCSSELFMLAGIKKTKIKNDYDNYNKEENEG